MKLNLALTISFSAFFSNLSAQQLTWSPPAASGNGTWNQSNTNWLNGNTPTSWNNSSSQALFPVFPGDALITLGSNVTVGSLELANGGNTAIALQNRTVTLRPGSHTWFLNGRRLAFSNFAQVQTVLSASNGSTLNLAGPGIFDAGNAEIPNLGIIDPDTNWDVAGTDLVTNGAVTIYGENRTIGSFDSLNLATGSVFRYDRDQSLNMPPDLILPGSGEVTLLQGSDTESGNVNWTGEISGSGGVRIIGDGTTNWSFTNSNNSFSGGVTIETSSGATSPSALQITGDAALGAVPSNFDPDNIRLVDGGLLVFDDNELSSNRGITLDGSGAYAAFGQPQSYGGMITGEGPFILGASEDHFPFSETLTLTSATHNYTNGTHIVRGILNLGVDEALPDDTILTIGSEDGISTFGLNGHSQTLSNLLAVGSNNQAIVNLESSLAPGTTADLGELILDIGLGLNTGPFSSNFEGNLGVNQNSEQGHFDITKIGSGGIQLSNVNLGGSIIHSSGALGLNGSIGGTLTVESGATLYVGLVEEQLVIGDFPGEESVEFIPLPTGQLVVEGGINLESGSSLEIEIDSGGLLAPATINSLRSDENVFIGPNVTLNLNDNVNATVDEGTELTFLEIEPNSPGIISGEFANLPDSSIFIVGSNTFRISYSSKEITLTRFTPLQNAFRNWISSFNASGGLNDDPDGDGITSGFEWFFYGENPREANSFFNAFVDIDAEQNGNFSYSHFRRTDRTNITVTYQWSTDLITWFNSGDSSRGLRVDFQVTNVRDTGFGGTFEEEYDIAEVSAFVTDNTSTGTPRIFSRILLTE